MSFSGVFKCIVTEATLSSEVITVELNEFDVVAE